MCYDTIVFNIHVDKMITYLYFNFINVNILCSRFVRIIKYFILQAIFCRAFFIRKTKMDIGFLLNLQYIILS